MDPAEAVLQEKALKFMNSSEREDCNNDEPPRKIIPEKNSLRQTYNSCARLCLNQETVCLGSTAMKTENCVAKCSISPDWGPQSALSQACQKCQSVCKGRCFFQNRNF